MTSGSVIEVATWRGVGRPDSRTSRLMLGMGSGNVNDDSDAQQPQSGQGAQYSSSQSAPAKRKPEGIKGYIFTIEEFIRNFNRINWSATFKALLVSVGKKKAPQRSNSEQGTVQPRVDDHAPAITPTPRVMPASEDAEIEEWLNKITEKASRTTSKASKAPAKKSPAKKATVTKKAAPKSAKKR